MPILPPAPEPQLVPGDPKVVALNAFNRYRQDFAEHFRTMGTMDALLGQVQEMPWKDLMDNWPKPPKYIAVHYGLEFYNPGGTSGNAYVLRLGFSGHNDDGHGSYTPPIAPFYMPQVEWDGSAFVESVPDVVGQWPAGELYVSKMKVARTDVDQGFVALDALDPRVCVFRYTEEMLALYTANASGSNIRDIKLQVNTIARCYNASDGGNAGFRQGICLCIVKKVGSIWERQLDNSATTLSLTGKGADFGALCPPDCAATS